MPSDTEEARRSTTPDIAVLARSVQESGMRRLPYQMSQPVSAQQSAPGTMTGELAQAGSVQSLGTLLGEDVQNALDRVRNLPQIPHSNESTSASQGSPQVILDTAGVADLKSLCQLRESERNQARRDAVILATAYKALQDKATPQSKIAFHSLRSSITEGYAVAKDSSTADVADPGTEIRRRDEEILRLKGALCWLRDRLPLFSAHEVREAWTDPEVPPRDLFAELAAQVGDRTLEFETLMRDFRDLDLE